MKRIKMSTDNALMCMSAQAVGIPDIVGYRPGVISLRLRCEHIAYVFVVIGNSHAVGIAYIVGQWE